MPVTRHEDGTGNGEGSEPEGVDSDLDVRNRDLAATNDALLREIAERERFEQALKESEDRLRTVVSNAPVVLFAIDADGIFTFSDGRALERLGFAPSEVVGRSAYDVYAQKPEITSSIRRALAGEAHSQIVRIGSIWFEVWCTPHRDSDDNVIGLIGVGVDVSRRVHAERAHRESEDRYELAVRGANDGIWDWDLKADQMYYSPRWIAILGLTEEEVTDSPNEWLERIHPEEVDRVRASLRSHLAGESSHFEEEHRIYDKDGQWRWVLNRGVAIRGESGDAYRMAGSMTDMTKRKAAEAELLHAALHDPLTELPNRNLFVEDLAAAIERMKVDPDETFAVLFLDLDRFKLVNDGLGHSFGDQLLIEVARRLRECVRPTDTVARLSGDEFCILLRGTDEVRPVTDRVQHSLRQVISLEGHEIYTSASVGVALGDRGYESAEEVLRDADTAMFQAKAVGRGLQVMFDGGMRDKAFALLLLENDLRRAVDRHEFRIDYQPIVSLETRRIRGFEALVRWDHPDRGVVPPSQFIELAEETGLIIPIGRWLLGEACQQIREWQKRYPARNLTISVNLSSREFSQPDLVGVIAAVLEDSGLGASSLRLEITETLIMENADSVLAMLIELKKLGVLLSIDDFGTGYSSLSRLHRFPIDTFKIDQSFVSRIGTEVENPEIVQTIVTLARNLGMDVIAEGVETEEQLRHLKELDCDWGQGFLFSRPTDAAGIIALLTAEGD